MGKNIRRKDNREVNWDNIEREDRKENRRRQRNTNRQVKRETEG